MNLQMGREDMAKPMRRKRKYNQMFLTLWSRENIANLNFSFQKYLKL